MGAEAEAAKRAAIHEDMQRVHRDASAVVTMARQARQDAVRANVKGFHAGGATDQASCWTVTKQDPAAASCGARRIPPITAAEPPPASRSRRPGLLRPLASGLVTLAITLPGRILIPFVIGRVVPIDPVLSIVGERATQVPSPAVRLSLGLDRPLWPPFVIHVRDAIRGDLGQSIRTRAPVLSEIARTFPATLDLASLIFRRIIFGARISFTSWRWWR